MLKTQNEKPGEILYEARNQESSRNQILGIPDWITLLILVLQRADAKTGSNTCVKRNQGSKVKRVERGVRACMLSCFSSKQFFATPGTIACQAYLSMGILQARILEWVVMPSSRGSSQPRDQTCVSFNASCALAGTFFTPGTTWEAEVASGHDPNLTTGEGERKRNLGSSIMDCFEV